MSETKVKLKLEAMGLDDIPQVVEIDRLSFPLPWPARAYKYELTENGASHFIVAVEPRDTGAERHAWFRSDASRRTVIGYVGFWQVVDEAHVSTIAVHPSHRGRGVGEQLLAAGLLKAIELGTARATLEVRVSNTAAQSLYRKYGFEVVGRRVGYYRDNGEDALIMTVYGMDRPGYRERLLEVIDR